MRNEIAEAFTADLGANVVHHRLGCPSVCLEPAKEKVKQAVDESSLPKRV